LRARPVRALGPDIRAGRILNDDTQGWRPGLAFLSSLRDDYIIRGR
jgi:hypothetical protein